MGKNYVLWPTFLLQRVCTRRGIRGMSTCKANETMVQLLMEQDLSEGRPSPYMDDLREIALGKTDDNGNAMFQSYLSKQLELFYKKLKNVSCEYDRVNG